MEDLIRQIVESDGALRARVADAEARLAALRREEADESGPEKQAEARAAREAQKLLAEAEAQARAAAKRAGEDAALREAALRRTFEAQGGAWVRELVRRCLDVEDGA